MSQPAPPLVFDHTAIVALFGQRGSVVHYWEQANEGRVRIVLPATAVAEANRTLQARWNAWQAVLLADGQDHQAVVVTPLDEHSAVEVGLLDGALPIGHVVHEAMSVRGIVVTREPNAYRDAKCALLPL